MSCRVLPGLAVLSLLAGAANAEEPFATPDKADFGLITGSTRKLPEGDAQLYCVNIADKAADARAAWQTKTISELEAKLDQRIKELEAKRVELEDWLKKRDEILARAGDQLVVIYSGMKPDAAALQLAALDDATAAGVIAKLKPRTASAILGEMEPGRAAQITKAIVQVNKEPEKKS
ncbi:MAG: MotE family protein [Parvibaculaceae bacterium]